MSPWMEAAKTLGVPALAVAVSLLAVVVSFASYMSARWQVRVAREKLRHDLYDRRFAVYVAFHALLVAVTEKADVDEELRKANDAKAHSPFLLGTHVSQYLERLHAEVFRVNADGTTLARGLTLTPDNVQQAARLGTDKLALINRIPELVQKFDCLRLNDLSRR
jgi:hypothetical protein